MNNSLTVEKVSVDYGTQRVVHELSFQAKSGEVLALLGPNGAGKTSLLKAAAGLIPSGGRILYGDDELCSLSLRERARRLAYVPQRSRLLASLTVQQVILQGRYCHGSAFSSAPGPRDEQAAERAMGEVDVADLAQRNFNQLSGGEQRRVLIARALATEASTILLDEPTASLDIAHALGLLATLRQLAAKGFAIVCVLHDLREARDACDRLLLLKHGHLQALGKPDEVLEAQRVRDVYGVELIEKPMTTYRLPELAS